MSMKLLLKYIISNVSQRRHLMKNSYNAIIIVYYRKSAHETAGDVSSVDYNGVFSLARLVRSYDLAEFTKSLLTR
jgi:hypothetical protein